MLLGNTSWRIRRVEARTSRMLVEDAHGAPPSVPFWRGEAPARTAGTFTAARRIAQRNQRPAARRAPGRRMAQSCLSWRTPSVGCGEECGLDLSGAEQLIQYTLEGRAVLGDVPTQTTIIAERFFDEGGGMQLIIHAPFGGRINKAWGLALAQALLPRLQFRTAGSGHRQRLEHRARRTA